MKEEGEEGAELGEMTEGSIELAGALAGAGVGLLAGPPGAVAGAVLGVVVERGLKAAVSRVMNRREQERAGAAVLLIEQDATRRSQAGERLRSDDFFDTRGDLRPDAEELLEGVLRQASQAYEERKVLVLANFYSALAHDGDVRAADAQFLLTRITRLTYRQLVALSVFAEGARYADELIQAHAEHTETSGHPGPDPTVELEVADLSAQRLIGVEQSGGGAVPLDSVIGGLGNRPSQMGYGRLVLLEAGEALARLARLDEAIPESDRRAWLEALRNS